MKKHRAKKIKIYRKIPKLSPITSIISKTPTKNTIPDLKIKFSAIRDLKRSIIGDVCPRTFAVRD